jgi:putative transposase
VRQAYRKSKRSSKQRTGRQERPAWLSAVLEGGERLVALLREGLDSFAVEVALLVAQSLLEEEVSELCGRRYERQEGRLATRYGRQPGYVVLAGQKLRMERPRVRTSARGAEVPLAGYERLQAPQAMPEAVLRRLVRGVSARDYAEVVDQAREGFGVSKSAVSRSFVQATAKSLETLCERRWDGVRWAALLLDGVEYAGEVMVVAFGITADGSKRLLGLRQGATENAEVCTALLEELRERGVATDVPTLILLDGAKALRAAVARVFGRLAVIQRCQAHKKRNVKAHVPERHWPEVEKRLRQAWGAEDYETALRSLKTTVAWLERLSPDAAASLREGMEETLTVLRLGVSPTLRRTLSTTNPAESALSVARTVTGRVKRWRNGDMRLRWCAAGLLRAETKFRRVKGHDDLPSLIRALDALVESDKLGGAKKVA